MKDRVTITVTIDRGYGNEIASDVLMNLGENANSGRIGHTTVVVEGVSE